ncbi:MAG: hypothetical protein M3O92_06080 [Actinomycetota bacterium]|nr:hypothetical protein [Actinomycetota bacterium]
MDTWVWIVIGVVVAIVVLGVLASVLRTRHSRSLRDSAGSLRRRPDRRAVSEADDLVQQVMRELR